MKKLLLSAALIALAGPALSADAMKASVIAPDTMMWQPHPALPKGAEFVTLIGDPTKAGDTLVQRVKFPPNYQVPAHTHPADETVTLISGTVGYGMGEVLDREKGRMMEAGAFFSLPAQHPHFVWTTTEESILQVQTVGPAGITYINPADDPRKQ